MHQVAALRLRSRSGPVHTTVHWPVPGAPPAGLIVLFPDGPHSSDIDHCRLPGSTLLVAPCRSPGDAIAVASWAADHTAELGVPDAPLAVIGDGRGAPLAEAVAAAALREGWPHLQLLLLIDPIDEPDPELGACVLRRLPTEGARR